MNGLSSSVTLVFFPVCITRMHWFANWSTHTEIKERPKKEANPSRWAGGRNNKPPSLPIRPALRLQDEISTHTPTPGLEVYTLIGPVMYSPDGLNDTYSLKAVPSRTAPAVEIEDRVYIPSVGAGKEPPIARVQLKDQPATTHSG